MSDEDFVDIPDYEGLYKINKNGQVLGMKRCRLLKPRVDSKGYFQVDLYKNGLQKTHRIHRLMGTTFLNLKDDEEIDHKNNNKLDNNLSNLRTATRSQNMFNRSDVVGYTIITLKSGNVSHQAYINKDKKRYTKTFKTLEEAQSWRDEKEKELFGDFEKYKEEN